MSGAAKDYHKWTFGVRVLANQIERATLRTTLTYKIIPELSLGVEYNPLADDVGPLANWTALKEKEWRPALIFGTSSDRIGTPSGRSIYGTLSKNLEPLIDLPVSPYVGAVWGSYEDRFRPIGGGTIEFGNGFSGSVIFDGVKVHPMLNYAVDRHVFSLILAQGKNPGFSYSISF